MVFLFTTDPYNFSLQLAFSQMLTCIHISNLQHIYNMSEILLQRLMNAKVIILENITKRKEIVHPLHKSHSDIKIIQWHHIIQIIQLYEPNCDLNKILIQAKINNRWQYLTINFSYSLPYETDQSLHLRYKIYEQQQINDSSLQDIEESLAECEKKIEEYKKKFDFNSMDISLFWASPLYRYEAQVNIENPPLIDNNLIDWSIGTQGYIKQIGQTLRDSKKRAYLTINLLNPNCFKLRNQYSIVYLICHTENQQARREKPKFQKRDEFQITQLKKRNWTEEKKEEKKEEKVHEDRTRYYFAGENNNGALVKIFPEDLLEMLKNKKIQLLILHTSFHCKHLQQILKCPEIHNVLVIKSNPIYSSKSTSRFLKLFFSSLINGQSISDAHTKSLNEVFSTFPNDEICCCYHEVHHKSCKGRVKGTNRYFGYHYRFHSIEKKQNECCCQSLIIPNFDYAVSHNLAHKFQLKMLKLDSSKSFQFEKGQLQGDFPYLKGFCYQKSLIGNRYLFIKLLKTFGRNENTKKINNKYKIFNIFNKICGDKRIFVLTVSNFLIKRKIIKENRIYESKFLDQIDFEQNNPDVLYTIFCNTISLDMMQKLTELQANFLIFSRQNLQIKDFISINPLNMKECQNYIKVQKHLTKDLKEKVNQFFVYTWKQKYRFMYYPSNFDYKSLMSMIAMSGLDTPQDKKQFKSYEQLIEQVDGAKFRVFIFVMSIYIHSSQKQLCQQKIQKLKFYREMERKFEKSQIQIRQLFFSKSAHFLEIIIQKNTKKVEQNLISILRMFVRFTLNLTTQQSWVFEQTTVSVGSLISMLFKKNIEECKGHKMDEQLIEFVEDCSRKTLFKAGLNLVRKIVTCFYLYEALEYKQEELVMKQKQTKEEEKSKQRLADENKWQQKIEGERKSKIQILSLILINNAIIYRKNTKTTLKIQESSEEPEPLFESNDENNNERSYIFSQQQAKQESRQEPTMLRESQAQEDNDKIYNENDFIFEVNCLTRNGLLYLLSKIRDKKPKLKILAVTDVLALQLLLQTIYQSSNVNENNFKILLSELQEIFNGWGINYIYGKFRIAFDILICLILVNTKCGQQKMTLQSSNKIDDYFKQLLYKERNEREIKQDQSNKELYQIIQSVCPTSQAFVIVRQHIIQCESRLKKKYREDRFIAGYVPLMQLHHQFNHCAMNIRAYTRINESYLRIFEMRRNLIQAAKQEMFLSQIVLYYMLNALSNKIDAFFKEIKEKLMIILTTNYFWSPSQKCKYMINFKNVLKKCKVKGHEQDSQEQMQELDEADFKSSLIVVTMKFHKKNLDQLMKIQGCKYLIIDANTQDDLMRIFRVNEISKKQQLKQEIKYQPKKKEKGKGDKVEKQKQDINGMKESENRIYEEISNKIVKIGYKYIFLSSQNHHELEKHLLFLGNEHEQSRKCNLIEFGLAMLKQLDEEEKNLTLLTLSLKTAEQIHKRSQSEVDKIKIIENIEGIRKGLKIKFGESRQQDKKLIELLKVDYKLNGEIPSSQCLRKIKEKQSSRVHYNIRMNMLLQQTEIIKMNYLAFITKVMETDPIEGQPKKIQGKAEQKINLQTFIQNFQFYLAQVKSIHLFFNFTDDERFSHRNSKEKKPKIQLVTSLMDEQFLSAFHSKQKMAVIIKWFESARDNSWLKEVMRSIFYKSDESQFENRYFNISGVPCLISLRISK